MKKILAAAFAASVLLAGPAVSRELSLAYFMGPKHPMNGAVFTPFAEKLADVSGGALTVQQYPGGALNSVPPKQYSILLDGVADIVFTLPGYTGDLFPQTNIITYPGICEDAVTCTDVLLAALPTLEKEYNAKVLAIWANSSPVLLTRDKPVRRLEDLAGMKIRVTSKQDVPFVEALGASAVAQPVNVIHQNLANGVIDAIAIDPSAIGSFKLHEPANYVTTWFPGSGSAFVLLMNKPLYESLSDEERAWVDAASGAELSKNGGAVYLKAGTRGLTIAADAGVELIELAEAERARFNAAVQPAKDALMAEKAGDMTVGDVIKLFEGM
ncbi:MAG: TRAP transporter substrate-binding protein [Rhodobacteraceae bacterium]|nr:TRAP transporter substrate-binding protein [Paracoccaceae bacterium]